MTKEEINEMSENDKIQTLKNYFTKEFTDDLESNGFWYDAVKMHPKNKREFKDSLDKMVYIMTHFSGFTDQRRIGKFKYIEVGDELGVRINHHIILERERLQYEDRFVYVMFDVIKYVVENLMDIDEVMMITHCDNKDDF